MQLKRDAASRLSQLTCLSFSERLLQTVRSHVIGMLGPAVVFTGRWHVETVWKLLYNEARSIRQSSLEIRAAAVFPFTPQPLLSLSPSLSVSFSLPHSLFEEARFSLSRFFSPIAADEPQVLWISSSVESCCCCRCASVGGAAELNGDDWQRVKPTGEPNTLLVAALSLLTGASLCSPEKLRSSFKPRETHLTCNYCKSYHAVFKNTDFLFAFISSYLFDV